MPAPLYLTTSRRPSPQTRALARTLARLLCAVFENRGATRVEDVAARAARLGLKRVVFLYEEKGKPARLAFWKEEWLDQEFCISSVKRAAARLPSVLPAVVHFTATTPAGKKLAELFGASEAEDEFNDPEDNCFISVRASAKSIAFAFDDVELLKLSGELV